MAIEFTYKTLDEHFYNNPLACAKFLIDGYEVTVKATFNKNRLVKQIFVNGSWKGVWLTKPEEYDEANRFMIIRERYVWSKSKREMFVKSNKKLKKLGLGISYKNIDAKHKSYLPYFSGSFRSVLKSWRERNENVELIELYP